MKLFRQAHSGGQSIVELALLLPAFLLLMVVTFDLGRGVYYYSAIYNAAREGTRYAIIHPEDIAGIKAATAKLAIGVGLDPSIPGQIVVSPDPPSESIDTVQVTINYEFQLVTPLAKLVTTCHCGHLDLTTSSTMMVER